MNSDEQFTHHGLEIGEVLETILAREIRKTINEEMLGALKDGRKPDLVPMTFDSEEDRIQYQENFEKIIDRKID